jgi:hypothetical protein
VIGRSAIHGYAIVSADDRIADSSGRMPEALRNEADWARFQAALDAAVLTVLGRLGHEAHPNRSGRNRLVLSSSTRGVEWRDGAWWWNPADLSFADALAATEADPGVVCVPGGRRVFDLFLSIGFDAFHLARASRVTIPGGIPIFSAVASGKNAEEILAGNGLVAGPVEVLDPVEGVDLTVWRRPLVS